MSPLLVSCCCKFWITQLVLLWNKYRQESTVASFKKTHSFQPLGIDSVPILCYQDPWKGKIVIESIFFLLDRNLKINSNIFISSLRAQFLCTGYLETQYQLPHVSSQHNFPVSARCIFRRAVSCRSSRLPLRFTLLAKIFN